MKFIHTPEAPAAIGPYSQAVVAGEWVFASGQIAIDPATGEVIDGGIGHRVQTECEGVGGCAGRGAVFDVSGAGDTVTAVVSLAVALGASMSEAAVLANHAAAVQVSKAGVATVTREELYEHTSTPMAAREVGRTKES